MEDFNQDIEAFFTATEKSECTRCPGNITQGRWELVSRHQPKCPRLSHRWVTWGHPPPQKTRIKPDAGASRITPPTSPLGYTPPIDLPEDPFN